MTTPGGCTAWAGVDDLPNTAADMHPPDRWCALLALATDVLWAATMRRWRGPAQPGTAVLRAAPPSDRDRWPWHTTWGHCACYAGTTILGLSWADRRSHHEPSAIRLPHPDVTAVTDVTVDGEPFTKFDARGAWLYRTDGYGWNMCGDRTQIAYTYGYPPPPAGVAACVEFAIELGRATSTDPKERGQCQLPRRVQSVNRQAISYEVAAEIDWLKDGLTGLYLVDAFIRSVNPYGRAQAARVWSPDIRRARSLT